VSSVSVRRNYIRVLVSTFLVLTLALARSWVGQGDIEAVLL
jgi:hypothetical protein